MFFCKIKNLLLAGGIKNSGNRYFIPCRPPIDRRKSVVWKAGFTRKTRGNCRMNRTFQGKSRQVSWLKSSRIQTFPERFPVAFLEALLITVAGPH